MPMVAMGTRTRIRQRSGAAVVEALRAEGVEHIFGLVGSHVLEIYDALADTPSIRHVTVKHETTASGMADAYGRLTGRPGVALVTAGPGATNSITGVAQAYMAASPMVHISGAVPLNAPYESFHGVDAHDFLVRMFAEVTKWSVAVERPEDIPGVLARAFAVATSGRPGPVHVELPQDVLLAEATEMEPYERQEIPPTPLDERNLHELTQQIRASRRPLIWAGKGVRSTLAEAELIELAELLQAPVILSGDATGSFSDTHPLSTGQLSLYERAPFQRELAQEADLIIVIGERGVTGHADGLFDTVGDTPVTGVWLGNDGEAIDPRAIGGARADIRTGLNQLIEACGDQQRPQDDALRARIAQERDGLRAHIMEGVRREYGDQSPMHYGMALDALPDFVDAGTICLGDIGSHNQWTRLLVQATGRNTFVPEGYWGAMGFGLPAAMAAKVAYPDKRVLSVTGDGCFLMASADFSTAVEYGLNPVIVILNDRQYGMIVGMQEDYYGRKSETELNGPDFVAFSRSFGGDGARVDHPSQMRAALEAGFASDRIFVIDAACDYRFPPYDFAKATEEFRREMSSD
ncbi:MAG TPA: thiamine pyrophosphate-binding protein [Thermomicrobiales bacterium]|nr:thiamine pyrophosphate-binding protein [Thermomicrobiales bacterium]